MPVRPVILSLFDYSGHWPYYFAKNGYDVIQVDLKHGHDVMTYQPPANVYGVLAAPPCTHLANSGAQFWKAKDADGRTAEAFRLVERTLEIIHLARPSFHVIENPTGRISHILGKPDYVFHPWQFAGYAPDPRSNRYTKRTCLWGDFTMPVHHPMEPLFWEVKDLDGKQSTKRSSFLWYMGRPRGDHDGEVRRSIRSQTPLGFAYATFIANRIPTPSVSKLTSFPSFTYPA